MTLTTTIPALADLVLVRYLLPKPQASAVREAINKLLPEPMSSETLGDVLKPLVSEGMLIPIGGRSKSLKLTDAGRTRALAFLGLDELPTRTDWQAIVRRHLFPQAAGLSADSAANLDNGEKLSMFLLKRKYALPTGTALTISKVMEALVCQQLGYTDEVTLDGLLQSVLSQLLNSPHRLTKEQLAKQVPLVDTGLKKKDAAAVRALFVREWLQRQAATPANDIAPEPFDLVAFANTVLTLARTSPPQDRYYGTKVFIAPVWQTSQAEAGFPRLTLDQFKARLIDAHKSNLLSLGRADLVQAMDPQLVAASETAYLNGTFHFILLE